MHNCQSLDPLVTPYVDGQLADAERRAVEAHLAACPPCYSRVASERAVHELLHTRKAALSKPEAPDALHARCGALAHQSSVALRQAQGDRERSRTVASHQSPVIEPRPTTSDLRPTKDLRLETNDLRGRSGLLPYALAASLAAIVGGAFVYQATDKSAHVLAAELVADHAKCFALNGALGTHQASFAVEQSMAVSFDWRVHLPDEPSRAGLELVGARPCLYGEGRVAHIMYRHQGKPVSLFMLPHTARAEELVDVLGHEAAIWCANNRTFVLVAREPRAEVQRMASFVQSALH